jgi:16S rRNA G966 N2-methylase RsmD
MQGVNAKMVFADPPYNVRSTGTFPARAKFVTANLTWRQAK